MRGGWFGYSFKPGQRNPPWHRRESSLGDGWYPKLRGVDFSRRDCGAVTPVITAEPTGGKAHLTEPPQGGSFSSPKLNMRNKTDKGEWRVSSLKRPPLVRERIHGGRLTRWVGAQRTEALLGCGRISVCSSCIIKTWGCLFSDPLSSVLPCYWSPLLS